MTITTNDVRDEYTASAAQTVFNYTFKIFADGQLDVYITPSGQEADDSTDITTAYTIDPSSIGDEDGGFLTLDSGTSDGDLVTIVSNIPESRTTDYQNSGDFLPDTVNADFDKVVSLVKQVEDKANRTLSFPSSAQNVSSLSLPEPDGGLYLAWKLDETGVENVGAPGVVVPTNIEFTVATMKANTSLEVGDSVQTQGYSAAGDGRQEDYIIKTAAQAALDGDIIDETDKGFTLANGLVAVKQETAYSVYSETPYTEGFDTPYYNPTAINKVKNLQVGSATPLDGHRHFGGIARTSTGRIIVTYRKSPGHATQIDTEIMYMLSDDGGSTFTAEAVLVAGSATYDNRSQSIAVTSTGRIVVNFNAVVVAGGAGNQFNSMFSDDDGETWSTPVTFVTNTETFSRLFGQMKEVPSDIDPLQTMLVSSAYYRNDNLTDFDVAYYRSYDNGDTWSSPVTIVSDTTGYNETALCWLSSQSIIAVSRGPNGLNLWCSIDAGVSWLDRGVIPPTSSDNQVAPSLNLVTVGSKQAVLLGYCDRAADLTTWQLDWAGNVCLATPSELFGEQITLSTTDDMVNASGYQSGVVYPSGEFLFVEFKEYTPTVSFPYSDVRIGVAYPKNWLGGEVFNKTLYRRDDVNPNIDAMIHGQVLGASTPVITSNSGSTSDRSHYALSQSDVLVGSVGTDIKGLCLLGADGISRFSIENANNKAFALGLNVGTLAESERTSNMNVGVNSASVPAITTSTGSSSSRTHCEFRNTNGEVGSITTSGTATAYVTSSDPELKTEFTPFNYNDTKGVINNLYDASGTFEFLSEPGKTVAGFNAWKVCDIDGLGSELGKERRGPRDVAIGEKYCEEDGVDFLVNPAGVDQSKAVPYLLAMVKLLMDKVEALENK